MVAVRRMTGMRAQRWMAAGLLVLLAGCWGVPREVHPPGLPVVPLQTTAERRAAFAQAYGLYRKGQLEPAAAIFVALERSYPELVDYHLYFSAMIDRRRKRDAPAAAAFAKLLEVTPENLHTEVDFGSAAGGEAW